MCIFRQILLFLPLFPQLEFSSYSLKSLVWLGLGAYFEYLFPMNNVVTQNQVLEMLSLFFTFSLKKNLYVSKHTRLLNTLFLMDNSLSPILTKVHCISFFNYNSNSDNYIKNILISLGRRDCGQRHLMEDPSSFCKQLKANGCASSCQESRKRRWWNSFCLKYLESGLSGWDSPFKLHKFRCYYVDDYRLNRYPKFPRQYTSRYATATHQQASHTTRGHLACWRHLQSWQTGCKTQVGAQ